MTKAQDWLPETLYEYCNACSEWWPVKGKHECHPPQCYISPDEASKMIDKLFLRVREMLLLGDTKSKKFQVIKKALEGAIRDYMSPAM